jgi:hypothetical protein
MSIKPNLLMGRIVGGTQAVESSWPFAAYIVQNYKGRYRIGHHEYLISYSWTCGATIINQKTLITAAHCIHDKYFEHMDPDTNVIYMLRMEWNDWFDSLEATIDAYVGVYDVKKLNVTPKFRARRVVKVRFFFFNLSFCSIFL